MTRSRLPTMIASALVLLGTAASASALPAAPLGVDDPLVAVAVDCTSAAARAARETGGRVLAARPSGATSCEITLLVPNEGGRPRRVVISVPV